MIRREAGDHRLLYHHLAPENLPKILLKNLQRNLPKDPPEDPLESHPVNPPDGHLNEIPPDGQ